MLKPKVTSCATRQRKPATRICQRKLCTHRQKRLRLDEFAKSLNLKQQRDWSSVEWRAEELHQYGLTEFISPEYPPSIHNTLQEAYPEFEWNIWQFPNCPKEFWHKQENLKQYMQWLISELQITTQHDFYRVPMDKYNEMGFTRFLKREETNWTNVVDIFRSVYPEFIWHPWLFESRSKGVWLNLEVQREFFDWTAEQLQIEVQEDWYRCNFTQFAKIGGRGLLKHHDGKSFMKAIASVYPEIVDRIRVVLQFCQFLSTQSNFVTQRIEFTWNMWMFVMAPKGFWQSKENELKYFKWLEYELGVESIEDWYSVSLQQIKDRGGSKLIHNYFESITKMLQHFYPNVEFDYWKFDHVPSGYWSERKNQRRFFDWLASQLNIKEVNDWYSVTQFELTKHGATALLNYHGSFKEALQRVYPEYKFVPWNFVMCDHGFWDDEQNVLQFMRWAEEQLGITDLDEWNYISRAAFIQLGGKTLLEKFRSLTQLLSQVYPDRTWNKQKEIWPLQKKTQRTLLSAVRRAVVK